MRKEYAIAPKTADYIHENIEMMSYAKMALALRISKNKLTVIIRKMRKHGELPEKKILIKKSKLYVSTDIFDWDDYRGGIIAYEGPGARNI